MKRTELKKLILKEYKNMNKGEGKHKVIKFDDIPESDDLKYKLYDISRSFNFDIEKDVNILKSRFCGGYILEFTSEVTFPYDKTQINFKRYNELESIQLDTTDNGIQLHKKRPNANFLVKFKQIIVRNK